MLTRFGAAVLVAMLTMSVTAQEPTNTGTLRSDYDRFEDRKKFDLLLMQVLKTEKKEILLNVHGERVGDGPAVRTGILFVILTPLPETHESCALDVIYDSERLHLNVVGAGTDFIDKRFAATAYASIEYVSLRKITMAKQVEMRLCNAEFQLTTAQLFSFRKFFGYYGEDLTTNAPRN